MINASADWIGTFNAFTMFYTGIGNVLIEISEFPQTPAGVVLIECTEDGGAHWMPLNMSKLGRGMITNATASGPAKFRGELPGGKAPGIRIRCQDTQEMLPIVVDITFAGGKGRHTIRGGSQYVIQEHPDLQDLIT